MDAIKKGPGRFRHWISGSIRRKLTLFVMVVCFLLIGLVWTLAVNLMEPVYMASIRNELENTVYTTLRILETAQADGLVVAEEFVRANGTQGVRLAAETEERLVQAVAAGELVYQDVRVDVATSGLRRLYQFGTLADSVLQPSTLISAETFYDGNLLEAQFEVKDSLAAVQLRERVFREGQVFVFRSGQMVMGAATGDGAYSVVAAVRTERITQAVEALRRLLLPISLALVAVSVLAAWVFSHWFTRPLNRVSAAAQEMAKGNYDVSVRVGGGDDEIAVLAGEFNNMAREVKRSAELQRDLLANVSHDLRTPLTLIKGYAETVRDLTGDDKQKRDEQLSVIVDESDRLSALVGSVLELSRMSSGNEKPVPVRFDLAEMCDEIAFRYEQICSREGCRFEFSAGGPCEVFADPDLTGRALHNLLDNALKHVGEDGYVGLRVHRTETGGVRAEVVDHGPGVAPEDMPHLFDRYYRARADAGRPGTGLGLSIVKAIFDSQGFRYGVESAPGEGATFWFEAPGA